MVQKSPIKYPGGKGLWIPDLMPLMSANDIRTFYEPFLGGGAISLSMAKANSDLLIYATDLSRPLTDFWQSLKSEDATDMMIEQLLAWHARLVDDVSIRRLWDRVGELMHAGENQTDRGAAFWMWNRMSFSGAASGGLSLQYVYRWHQAGAETIRQLSIWTPLMQNMSVICGDYEQLMRQAEAKDVVFLDPPYEQAKGARLYGHGNRPYAEAFDHQRFQGVAESGTGARMIMTYNEEIADLYPLWSCRQLIPRRSAINHADKGRHEALILNFTPGLLRREQCSRAPAVEEPLREKLRAVLKARAWSPREAAEHLGLTPRAVQFWLAGERKVPKWVLKQLS